MKAFFSWLAITVASFAGLGGGYHLVLDRNPKHVLVVVDSSFAMKPDWSRIPGILDRIDDARYSLFALDTEKGPVHGYQRHLDGERLMPYAPRDLSKLKNISVQPEFARADKYILVTNAPASATAGLDGWTIVRP